MNELADKDTALNELFDADHVAQMEAVIRLAKDTGERSTLVEDFLLSALQERTDVAGLVKSVPGLKKMIGRP